MVVGKLHGESLDTPSYRDKDNRTLLRILFDLCLPALQPANALAHCPLQEPDVPDQHGPDLVNLALPARQKRALPDARQASQTNVTTATPTSSSACGAGG
jgi:hypothetical protein